MANRGGSGAGAYLLGGNARVVGCEFVGNVAVGMGGAIATEQVEGILVLGCDIHNNESGTGGGICLTTGPGRVEDCTVTGNSSPFGGGLAVMSAWDVTVERCDISLNTALVSGGGMYVLDASASVWACEIHGNGTGVHVEGVPAEPVAAQWNWWGDASGPHHPLLNPGGTGDAVSDFVDFAPWNGVTGIPDPEGQPPALRVHPNPSLGPVALCARVADAGRVRIGAYDAAGHLVALILDDVVSAGVHALAWDAHDADGRPVPAGVYFLRADVGPNTVHEKLVIVR